MIDLDRIEALAQQRLGIKAIRQDTMQEYETATCPDAIIEMVALIRRKDAALKKIEDECHSIYRHKIAMIAKEARSV